PCPAEGLAGADRSRWEIIHQHAHFGIAAAVRVNVVRAEPEHIVSGIGECDVSLVGCAGRKGCHATSAWEAVVAAVIDAGHRPPVYQRPAGHTVVRGRSLKREGVTTID